MKIQLGQPHQVMFALLGTSAILRPITLFLTLGNGSHQHPIKNLHCVKNSVTGHSSNPPHVRELKQGRGHSTCGHKEHNRPPFGGAMTILPSCASGTQTAPHHFAFAEAPKKPVTSPDHLPPTSTPRMGIFSFSPEPHVAFCPIFCPPTFSRVELHIQK